MSHDVMQQHMSHVIMQQHMSHVINATACSTCTWVPQRGQAQGSVGVVLQQQPAARHVMHWQQADVAYRWLFHCSSCSKVTPYMQRVLHASSCFPERARRRAAHVTHASSTCHKHTQHMSHVTRDAQCSDGMQRVLRLERVHNAHTHRLHAL